MFSRLADSLERVNPLAVQALAAQARALQSPDWLYNSTPLVLPASPD